MNSISSINSLQQSSLIKEETEEISTIQSIFKKINRTWLPTCNIPGPIAIFSIPYELITTARALSYAQTIGDEEALQDALLKLAGLPSYLLYSVLTMSQVIIQIGLFIGIFQVSSKSHIVPKGLLITAVAGVVFCGIEAAGNITTLIKQQKFLNKLPNRPLFSLDHWEFFPSNKQKHIQETALEDLSFFTQYLEPTSEKTKEIAKKTFNDSEKCQKFLESFQEAKLAQLSKKVMPWFAEKVAKELPSILKKIASDDLSLQKEGILEGRALLKDAKIQAQKQSIRQIVSLIAIGFSLAGCLGLLGIGMAYFGWIPLGLFGISFIVYLVNYLFSSGTLYHTGWDFNPVECIPNWIRTRLPIC